MSHRSERHVRDAVSFSALAARRPANFFTVSTFVRRHDFIAVSRYSRSRSRSSKQLMRTTNLPPMGTSNRKRTATACSGRRVRYLAIMATAGRMPAVVSALALSSCRKRPRCPRHVVQHASSSSAVDAETASYFDRIGRPRTVLAPMVSQSDLPFRLLCRKYGAELAYTQMIHAKNYGRSEDFRSNHLDIYAPGQSIGGVDVPSGAQMNCLDGRSRDFGPGGFDSYRKRLIEEGFAEDDASFINPVSPIAYPEEGPVVVQLAGHDPTLVADAALDIVERTRGNVAGIDLNGGCPQKIASKGRYGAFLHEEEPEV